jgi:hypothetical protein
MTTGLDAATAELLAGSLREVLTKQPERLAATLDELGWDEVLADDPAAATTLLFTEHGRALANSRVLDDVVLSELDLPDGGPRAVLYSQPGCGLLLGPLDGIAEVVVLDGSGSVRILPADQVSARAATGFDQGSGWLVTEPIESTEDTSGSLAVAAAQRALAAEIIGACEAALALAVTHTASRVQYGRPIATFQAVRHRLSEAHVAVESARASLAAAWTDGGTWAARLAKLRAGYAQAEVMRHAVQVFGAMGLSREGELHGYVTRAAALDTLLGDHRTLAEEIGAALLAGADLEPVIAI